MILYHGSNQTIKEPSLQNSRSSLDFGAGFYLTSDIEQAQKWAKRVTHIREKGEPVVSVYETNDMIWQTLSILRLEHADKEWLRLVVAYRTNHPIDSKYDIITGPVADDRTVDVINQYISGAYPEDIALQLLLPLKFKDQWTMKTERAISALIWKEAIQV